MDITHCIQFFQDEMANFLIFLWLEVYFAIWSQVTVDKFPNDPRKQCLACLLRSTPGVRLLHEIMSSCSSPPETVVVFQGVLLTNRSTQSGFMLQLLNMSVHTWAAFDSILGHWYPFLRLACSYHLLSFLGCLFPYQFVCFLILRCYEHHIL